MPRASCGDSFQVALLGNPNTGKSTLFSALVGVHQRVGNYPGVTVEKRIGECAWGGRHFKFIDLPGLYSLSPRSRDELVAVEVLLSRFWETPPVDAILCIVDASNLERNLYLVGQILELRLPTVVALNMLDVAEDSGVTIDVKRLEERLGVPVVPVQANRGVGLVELREALARIDLGARPASPDCFPPEFNREVARLTSLLSRPGPASPHEESVRSGRGGFGVRRRHRHGWRRRGHSIPEWLAQRVLLDTGGLVQTAAFAQPMPGLDRELQDARARLGEAGYPVPSIETTSRYDWVRRILHGVAVQPPEHPTTASDRVDRVLTHPLWGTLLFVLIVVMLFQAVFVWAGPLVDVIEAGVRGVGSWITAHMVEGALRGLLVDGVLGGVGAVLAFLPQILVLFLFLAVLEDCGYLARAAYLMDGLMVRVGLSGKSFLPLLSSFACAVPGIMATRVIENHRDRLTTILVAPLMTCSARLPVFALLIAAFVPYRTYLGGLLNLQGLTLVALYFLGVIAAVAVAKILKKTVLRGDAPPFLMELPTYKWPSARTIVLRVAERAYSFVCFAGTMILAVSIVVWAALYYPHDRDAVEGPFQTQREQLERRIAASAPDAPQRQEAVSELAALETRLAAAYQRQSYLGRFGHAIEPVFRPLGWDWRIGTAVIASFPAREIVVATLGVVFSSESEGEIDSPEDAPEFHARLRNTTWEGTGRPLFNVPVALSIMVFYALCAQCVATLAVIRQETNTWRWPAFAFAYMTALAYGGAFATYQIGMWIGG